MITKNIRKHQILGVVVNSPKEMIIKKERELPDAYPSDWHDQVTILLNKYGEVHAPIGT